MSDNKQSIINFPVKKSARNLKIAKEKDVHSVTKSPIKRLRQDENGNACSHINNNNVCSPSKRSRSLSENFLTRLPLSPRKDIEGSNICRSPLVQRTPSRLRNDEPVLTVNESPCTPSRHSINSPLSNGKVLTPSQCVASAAIDNNNSPSRSTRRNLATCFTSISANENKSPSKNQSCTNQGTLQLAKQSALCYQNTKMVLNTALPSDDLVGRSVESKFINDFLSKHLSQKTAASLYVSGAPGTGKTAVLSKAVERVKADKKCRVTYINCMTKKNAHDIYKVVLSSLLDKPVHSSAKQTLANIEKNLTNSKTMNLLVLDEMDSLDSKNQEVLYSIFEWPSLPSSKLILIGIANSLDLTDRILPRLNVRSWCRPQLLHFAPYTREEIVSIINHRLGQVTDGETMLEQSAVQMCARKISAVAGDARAAIDVCRRAVESVEADSRHQLLLQSTVCTRSPAKRTPSFRKVGLRDVLKVIGEASGGWTRTGTQSERSVTLPLQHTVAICTLLLMLNGKSSKVTTKEVTFGKFHETFSRVCKQHGIGAVEQSEFLTLCQLVESRGIFALKTARDTRASKVWLKMDETELQKILQDQTLMSAILKKGLS